MSKPSYKVAKSVLSEVEKDRILACYFAISEPNSAIDFNKAAEMFGSASVESFKKMIQTAFKKVQNSADVNGDVSADQAAPTTKAKGGRKRKTSDGENDNNGGKPATKKASPKRGKKAKEAILSEDEGDAGLDRVVPKLEAGGAEDNVMVNTDGGLIAAH